MNKITTHKANNFLDEESSRLYFEKMRWNGAITCAHCNSVNCAESNNHKPMTYRCKTCRKHFSVRTGTVLAESRLPLFKWKRAVDILTAATEDIPVLMMAEKLGVSPTTAWSLSQRIAECWATSDDHIQANSKPKNSLSPKRKP